MKKPTVPCTSVTAVKSNVVQWDCEIDYRCVKPHPGDGDRWWWSKIGITGRYKAPGWITKVIDAWESFHCLIRYLILSKLWDRITDLVEWHLWSMGMYKSFHPTLFNGCNHWSIFESIQVCKRGPRKNVKMLSAKWQPCRLSIHVLNRNSWLPNTSWKPNYSHPHWKGNVITLMKFLSLVAP